MQCIDIINVIFVCVKKDANWVKIRAKLTCPEEKR